MVLSSVAGTGRNKSLITESEREAYESYERLRRLRMLRLIGASFIGLSLFAIVPVTIFFLFVLPPGQRNWSVLGAVDLTMFVVATSHTWSYIEGRRGRLLGPSILVMVTAGFGAAAVQVFWDMTQHVDDFSLAEITAFSVVIVLAGVLGNGWMITIATGTMNVLTVIILLVAPHSRDFRNELTLIVPTVLLFQWIFAAIMYGVWLSFQRSLGELGVAYQRAQQLDDLKNQFISSVNHELRTPLMALQNYLQLLQRPDIETDDAHYAITHANMVLDSLVNLVQSILSTRQIDREGIQIDAEAIEVRHALEAAIQLLDPREAGAIERPLSINIPDATFVWADRIKLQQILTNVLSNAIKYSSAGSPIEVIVAPVTQEIPTPGRFGRTITTQRAMIEIAIHDHGLGIPPDQIALLFNRFTRLPRDLASKVVGNGLGLYLCRTFADAMGGSIGVESTGQEGEGSTFFLRLPIPTVAIG